MDHGFKDQTILRRIISGFFWINLEYQDKLYMCKYTDPSLEVQCMADFIYNKKYEENQGPDGIITLDGTIEILKKRGVWTEKDEVRFKGYPSYMSTLEKQVANLRFKKTQQKAVLNQLDDAKKQYEELFRKRTSLAHMSLESFCEKARRYYVLEQCCSIPEKPELIKNKDVIESLVVLIDRYDNGIDETIIRRLARSHPFRGMWIATRESGNQIFGCSMSEMTALQQKLVMWSMIYDYAYNHTERPADEIIDDDIQFDIWYNNSQEKDKQSHSDTGGNVREGGIVETFIPADASGAKEVYDLNDPVARRNIRQRENALKKKGVVKEQDMPDTRKRLQVASNQLAIQKGKNR